MPDVKPWRRLEPPLMLVQPKADNMRKALMAYTGQEVSTVTCAHAEGHTRKLWPTRACSKRALFPLMPRMWPFVYKSVPAIDVSFTQTYWPSFSFFATMLAAQKCKTSRRANFGESRPPRPPKFTTASKSELQIAGSYCFSV